MATAPVRTPTPSTDTSWRKVVARYQHPDIRRSVWQVANTFIPYFVLWYFLILSLEYHYLLTLALTIPASGFLVRIFIILHDCGHGSFFPSRRASDIIGTIAGILTFTPYYQWRHDHAMHHATAGDLDRRGHGDVHTLTVAEYQAMTPWQRLEYRVFRHPLVMLTIGPFFTFIYRHRFVLPTSGPRERLSVYGTNAALAGILALMAATIGLDAYLLIQGPIALFAGATAIWLFYCQHQFEDTYWASHTDWDYETAALKGSSYFQLPPVLQWFTGNIGFHHVHHLSPRIPNYHLEECHNAYPRFQEATTLTIGSSLACFELKLWDEARNELVPLKEVKVRG